MGVAAAVAEEEEEEEGRELARKLRSGANKYFPNKTISFRGCSAFLAMEVIELINHENDSSSYGSY